MKFWLATANPQRAEECLAYGIFEGVITNPHVVAIENRPPTELFSDLCKIAPFAYYQLRAGTADEMLREADQMLSVDPGKMRIKVPATRDGFSVIRQEWPGPDGYGHGSYDQHLDGIRRCCRRGSRCALQRHAPAAEYPLKDGRHICHARDHRQAGLLG